MRKDDCIFCKLANGDIPSRTLYEDEMFRVIMDLSPMTKGHSLILPKEHADNLYELEDDIAARVLPLAKKMASLMTDKLDCEGFNLLQNNGEVAGQTIHHFHLHLIPRYADDGQELTMVPSEPTAEELDEVKRQILG